MKKLFNLIIFTFIFSITSYAQSVSTGDSELDIYLKNIDVHAKVDYTKFEIQMSKDYKVENTRINYMTKTLKMTPGEIVLLLEADKLSDKELTDLLKIYNKEKDKGWTSILKKSGIKTDTPTYETLKNNVKKQSVAYK